MSDSRDGTSFGLPSAPPRSCTPEENCKLSAMISPRRGKSEEKANAEGKKRNPRSRGASGGRRSLAGSAQEGRKRTAKAAAIESLRRRAPPGRGRGAREATREARRHREDAEQGHAREIAAGRRQVALVASVAGGVLVGHAGRGTGGGGGGPPAAPGGLGW